MKAQVSRCFRRLGLRRSRARNGRRDLGVTLRFSTAGSLRTGGGLVIKVVEQAWNVSEARSDSCDLAQFVTVLVTQWPEDRKGCLEELRDVELSVGLTC